MITAIGPATAARLREFGINADIVPETFSSEGILQRLKELKLNGELYNKEGSAPNEQFRILLPCSAQARRTLPEKLAGIGFHTTILPVYETIETGAFTEQARLALQDGTIDSIILCSPSAVNSCKKALEEMNKGTESRISVPPITAIGPVTARHARKMGFSLKTEAARHSIDGIVEALQMCRSGHQPGEPD
jgi:uroporphyrinogen III methyltransferase/synthase